MSGLIPSAAAALIVMMAAACPSGEESAPELELPDVSGTWDLSFMTVPVGTDGDQGRCYLQPITLELTLLRFDAFDSLYGVHAAGEVICSDITELATQLSGVSDTTIQFEAGTVTGKVAWLCDGPVGYLSFVPTGCPANAPEIPWVEMSFIGQGFRGEVSSSLMSGDFGWVDTVLFNAPSTVVYGTWRALRQPR